MIVVFVCLSLIGYTKMILLPTLCASMAFGLFIGYSLWLWIKKPQKIVINGWLSNIDGLFTLYYIIIVALDSKNPWWYAFPVICAIFTLFICMIKPKDEIFVI